MINAPRLVLAGYLALCLIFAIGAHEIVMPAIMASFGIAIGVKLGMFGKGFK